MIAGNHDSPGAAGLRQRPDRRRGPASAWPGLRPAGARGARGCAWAGPCPSAALCRAGGGAPGAGRRGDDRSRRRDGGADRPGARRAAGRRAWRGRRACLSSRAGRRASRSARWWSAAPGRWRRSGFDGFCYAALGHLHRPQAMEGGRVRYSGSLLKYSFDEAAHRKSVSLVEIAADGAVAVEEIALPLRRDVRIVEGTIEQLTRDPPLLGRDDWAARPAARFGRGAGRDGQAARGLPQCPGDRASEPDAGARGRRRGPRPPADGPRRTCSTPSGKR